MIISGIIRIIQAVDIATRHLLLWLAANGYPFVWKYFFMHTDGCKADNKNYHTFDEFTMFCAHYKVHGEHTMNQPYHNKGEHDAEGANVKRQLKYLMQRHYIEMSNKGLEKLSVIFNEKYGEPKDTSFFKKRTMLVLDPINHGKLTQYGIPGTMANFCFRDVAEHRMMYRMIPCHCRTCVSLDPSLAPQCEHKNIVGINDEWKQHIFHGKPPPKPKKNKKKKKKRQREPSPPPGRWENNLSPDRKTYPSPATKKRYAEESKSFKFTPNTIRTIRKE